MSVIMKNPTVQLLHDLAEANEGLAEPTFVLNWETFEVTAGGME